MSRESRYVLGAAIGLVLIGAACVTSGNSVARLHGEQAAHPEIDVRAIMIGAKDLPTEQFDAT
jgi:hypothetical protein